MTGSHTSTSADGTTSAPGSLRLVSTAGRGLPDHLAGLVDVAQYQPMVAATLAALDAANITTPIGCVLADAGYWSEGNATADGPDRLIATLKDHKQRRAARPAWHHHR